MMMNEKGLWGWWRFGWGSKCTRKWRKIKENFAWKIRTRMKGTKSCIQKHRISFVLLLLLTLIRGSPRTRGIRMSTRDEKEMKVTSFSKVSNDTRRRRKAYYSNRRWQVTLQISDSSILISKTFQLLKHGKSLSSSSLSLSSEEIIKIPSERQWRWQWTSLNDRASINYVRKLFTLRKNTFANTFFVNKLMTTLFLSFHSELFLIFRGV